MLKDILLMQRNLNKPCEPQLEYFWGAAFCGEENPVELSNSSCSSKASGKKIAL